MAILQSNLSRVELIDDLPLPANTDEEMKALSSDQKIVAWLFRLTARNDNKDLHPSLGPSSLPHPFEKTRQFLIDRAQGASDDWQAVASIAGHSVQDLIDSGIDVPLSAAEIDHFRRNHRETDRLVGRDFLSVRCDLPSPLAELYGLYRHRARLDTESTLFVAQATGSTRVARLMADLLAIGAFASGHECVTYMSQTYSVPAAFDTAELIDRTASEALRRLSLPIETPANLLKLTPDEISVLASNIVDRNVMGPAEFLEKARTLSEARQDVHRIPPNRQLASAIMEGDLSMEQGWTLRLCKAYRNIFPSWNVSLASSADTPPSFTGHSVS